MKKSEVLSLATELAKLVDKDVGNVKAAYAIARNIKIIAPIVSDLESLKEKVTKEFEDARTALCELHADKDEDGKVKVENDQYVGLPNDEFSDALKELIESHQPRIQEFNDLLQEDEDVELYKVDIENLPSTLTAQQMLVLFSIIKE